MGVVVSYALFHSWGWVRSSKAAFSCSVQRLPSSVRGAGRRLNVGRKRLVRGFVCANLLWKISQSFGLNCIWSNAEAKSFTVWPRGEWPQGICLHSGGASKESGTLQRAISYYVSYVVRSVLMWRAGLWQLERTVDAFITGNWPNIGRLRTHLLKRVCILDKWRLNTSRCFLSKGVIFLGGQWVVQQAFWAERVCFTVCTPA